MHNFKGFSVHEKTNKSYDVAAVFIPILNIQMQGKFWLYPNAFLKAFLVSIVHTKGDRIVKNKKRELEKEVQRLQHPLILTFERFETQGFSDAVRRSDTQFVTY